MSLMRLVYASRFSRKVSHAEIQKIINISREKNPALGITGALCFDPRYFLQCIEGPRDAVNALYNRIVADERHKDVTLIAYQTIEKRLFDRWAMAYVRVDKDLEPILLRYSPGPVFDPYVMSAEQALAFSAEAVNARDGKTP